MKKGISIVICCYNSSRLIGDCLLYICRSRVPDNLKWEVIVVDNNSNDDTSAKAEKILSGYGSTVSYNILSQPEPGLSSARRTGFENAEYEYVIFCDDDNRLNENYLELAFNIMEGNKKIGAMGGDSIAITDGSFPEWFKEYQRNYSVGKQSEKPGDITWENSGLWGAGMVLRREALADLFSQGYKSLLSDRKGNQLSSGGDIEMCYALRLAGWKIWYEPGLKLDHYIIKEKLNWSYLRRLSRGFGAQKVDFDAYLKAFEPKPKTFNQNLEQRWIYQSIRQLKKIRRYGIRKLMEFNRSGEGDSEILRIEKAIGRLRELLKIRGLYSDRINSVKNASWRKIFSTENT
ncbi:MAG: glycosyltransferase [bacterium]|nr:glycosyltransferase [bacterium]